MIRVLLIDDDARLRHVTSVFLSIRPGFQLVGSCGSGEDGVRLCQESQPDVVVTDMVMDGMSGVDVAARLHQTSPEVGVVVWSAHQSEAYAARALDAGAKSYLAKSAGFEVLAEAILAVASDQVFLAPPLTEQRLLAYRQSIAGQPGAAG